jgi:hypothetical protein
MRPWEHPLAALKRELAGRAEDNEVGDGPFEAADVAFIETLKAGHETVKVQLAGVERAQDAQHAAKITAELQEIADKASAEFSRIADRLAAFTEARSRPWWRRLVG